MQQIVDIARQYLGDPKMTEGKIIDIIALILREAEQKNREGFRSKGNKQSVAAALAFACACHALLNETAAQIGIDQTPLGSVDGRNKFGINDTFLFSETRKRFRFEKAHPIDSFYKL